MKDISENKVPLVKLSQDDPLYPYSKKIKYDKLFLDEDYKRKVTDPILTLMKEVAEERGLTLKQMAGAVLK